MTMTGKRWSAAVIAVFAVVVVGALVLGLTRSDDPGDGEGAPAAAPSVGATASGGATASPSSTGAPGAGGRSAGEQRNAPASSPTSTVVAPLSRSAQAARVVVTRGCRNLQVVRPRVLEFGCGRSAPQLSGLQWSRWTKGGALGLGVFTHRAGNGEQRVLVKVQLSQPDDDVFTRAVLIAPDEDDRLPAGANEFSFDGREWK